MSKACYSGGMSDIECPDCSFVYEPGDNEVQVRTGSPIFFNERFYTAIQCPNCHHRSEFVDITDDQLRTDWLTQLFNRPDIVDRNAPEG